MINDLYSSFSPKSSVPKIPSIHVFRLSRYITQSHVFTEPPTHDDSKLFRLPAPINHSTNNDLQFSVCLEIPQKNQGVRGYWIKTTSTLAATTTATTRVCTGGGSRGDDRELSVGYRCPTQVFAVHAKRIPDNPDYVFARVSLAPAISISYASEPKTYLPGVLRRLASGRNGNLLSAVYI